jgi:alkylated DNA repair dioxygenase AlkB
MSAQLNLFARSDALPDGFRYAPDVITPAQEAELVAAFERLTFREFEFHGYLGKRRIVSYGWTYDYSARALRPGEHIPDFLLAVRQQAGRFAGIPSPALQQILVTEYRPGAAIGWHKDKPEFGDVVGISLLSPCTFRLRRASGSTWQRASLTVEPRSAYLMSGPSRTQWEHSIPGVERLRYSITFRTLQAR